VAFEPPESIRYETRDGKAYITINRPQAMNAMNLEVIKWLPLAFKEFNNDDSLYVAILAGEGGRAFSAGGDLKEQTTYVGTDKDPRRTGADDHHYDWSAAPKPVIAAIDGYAFAGGLEMALQCDFRFATRKSQFAIPEVKRSLIAGPGTTHLPRVIPLGDALMMTLTGEPIDAERAYQIGLVQGLADDREQLFQLVDRYADAIAANPPLAVQDIKTIVKKGVNVPLEYAQYLREKYFDSILQTEDALEGPLAFAEKRAPVWKRR
jgi:enoyl-CoA hydratase/carnithine racemase